MNENPLADLTAIVPQTLIRHMACLARLSFIVLRQIRLGSPVTIRLTLPLFTADAVRTVYR